jgi:hypothetical protein
MEQLVLDCCKQAKSLVEPLYERFWVLDGRLLVNSTIGLRPPPDDVGRQKGCKVRIARHSLTTNSFDAQFIEVFLETATTAGHHLISDREQPNRLSDWTFQPWRLAFLCMIFSG